MVRTQRPFPHLSLTLFLAITAAMLGVAMAVTPLDVLTRLGLLISPRDTLEPKTILLLAWLKRLLPLLSVATLLWLFTPATARVNARRRAARLLQHPWTFPTILVVAYGVRLAWAMAYPTHPFADSEWYYRTAAQLRDGAGFVYDLKTRRPLVAWPVGYPLFLATIFRVTGPSVWVAKVANIVLAVACVALTYDLARRLFNVYVAALAALLLALLPGFVVYVSLVSTDLLFMTLFTGAYVASLRSAESPRPARTAVAVGIVNGALALVRGPGLFMAPVWAWLQWQTARPRLSLRRAVLLTVAGTFIVLAPWMVRNYLLFDRLIFVSANTGVNLWIGNNPNADGAYAFPRDMSNPLFIYFSDALATEDHAYRLAFEFMRTRPGDALRLLPAKLFFFYNANDYGLHWNRLSARDPAQRGGGVAAFAFVNVVYVMVVLAAGAGVLHLLLGPRRTRLAYSGLWIALYWTLIHLPFFGQDRFILPLLPVLTMYAGVGIAALLGLSTTPGAVTAAASPAPVSDQPQSVRVG